MAPAASSQKAGRTTAGKPRPADPEPEPRVHVEFLDAFEFIMGSHLERRMLLALYEAKRAVRYEELRKTVNEDRKQIFKNAVDKLLHHVLVVRQLEPRGERYATKLAPTRRGALIAEIVEHLGKHACLPPGLDDEVATLIGQRILGQQ